MNNKVFKSIRIVNSGKLWQESESWNSFEIYDTETGNLITEGNDIIEMKGKLFLMECKPNIEGIIYYGASFEFTNLGSNSVEINVI